MIFPVLFLVSRPKTRSFRRLILTLSAGLLPLAAVAESETYVPYSGIVHGTEGADPIELSITNETGVVMDCRAALAHWYSDELGHIAQGEQLALTLWHDAETGVLNLMNATNDRMPVEAVWCATEAARTRLDLPMTAGRSKPSLHFTCQTSGNTELSCDERGD